MTKFHINPETGRAGQCNAKSPESCKFSVEAGTVVAHYETKDEAKAAFEKLNQSKTTGTIAKKQVKKSAKKKDLDETRKQLGMVNRRVERLQGNLQHRKNLLADLDKSLNLDMSKEEREEIHEKMKDHREQLLVLSQMRSEGLAEQKALAKEIEKETSKNVEKERKNNPTAKTPISELDRRIAYNDVFFTPSCGRSC